MLRAVLLVVGAAALVPRLQPTPLRASRLRAAALEWSPAGVAQADGTLVSRTFA